MSDIPAIKRVLLGEKTDRMRKLDMLVRQGMMSPAQLPMLHRGLDKLQAGQTLAPTERAAVAKVMDSLMYIVTGDDTVFQKAKMHTQKTRYQTEEAELTEEEFELDMFSESYKTGHKSYTDAVNHAFDHHAKSGLTSSQDDKAQHIGLDSKRPGSGKTTRVNIPATHKSGKKHMIHMQVYNKGGSHPYELNTYSSTTRKLQKEELETIEEKNTPTNPKLWASKISAAKSKFDVYPSAYANGWAAKEYKKAGGGWKSESVEYTTEEPVMEMNYKEKFAAMLKKSGKSLDQMDDDEKKKFFTTVDAAHKAKNEDTEIDEAIKLKGFGKDAGPSNMSNPAARASLMKSTPAVKKKVSDMTPAEKMANAKRRKEYNEYQKSKRNAAPHNTSATQGKMMSPKGTMQESDLDANEIIEPEVVETQTPEVESVVDQNMRAYVQQITQHAKDTNF